MYLFLSYNNHTTKIKNKTIINIPNPHKKLSIWKICSKNTIKSPNVILPLIFKLYTILFLCDISFLVILKIKYKSKVKKLKRNIIERSVKTEKFIQLTSPLLNLGRKFGLVSK